MSRDEPSEAHDPFFGTDLLGEEHIEEFDPPPDMSEEKCLEWEAQFDRWRFGSQPPFGDKWNTLPFGARGNCCDKLFVDFRSSMDVHPLLQDTVLHLAKCPATKLVVFHVSGSVGYLEWMYALVAKLPMLRKYAAADAKFATRIAYSWMPRPLQRPEKWKGAICRGKADNDSKVDMTRFNRVVFKHRIWLLEELGLLHHDFGYVRLHTGQPTDLDSGADISFGLSINDGNAIQAHQARLYAGDRISKHPLGFHEELLRFESLSFGRGRGIGKNTWIAKSRADFLMDPYLWLNKAALGYSRL